MNALFLKDLAIKVHHGLVGRVRQGKSAGGLPYGYRVQRCFSDDGEPLTGLRTINLDEAAVIQRVFKMFASGTSPRSIANTLNAEGIPAPSGGLWAETTIRGHAKRRTGILRNDNYRGKLVWNKQRFVKDPSSGKRLARSNPESDWVWQDTPELRIVSDDLWDKTERMFAKIRDSAGVQKALETRFWEKRRPKHLLSGLVRCGCCGGNFAGIGRDYLACSASRRFGSYENRNSVRRKDLETAVLGTLKNSVLRPELVAEFIRAYHQEINQRAAEASATSDFSKKGSQKSASRSTALSIQSRTELSRSH